MNTIKKSLNIINKRDGKEIIAMQLNVTYFYKKHNM